MTALSVTTGMGASRMLSENAPESWVKRRVPEYRRRSVRWAAVFRRWRGSASGASFEKQPAIVGMLADSALLESGLEPDSQPALRNISLTLKKSAHVGVLIVDDEALIRWSLAEMLSDQGYAVYEAGDGRDALAILRNPPNPVEVIMLDYRLPDLNGLQLLAAIRDVSPHSRVVMMTSYGTPDIAADALSLGAVGFVDKPIEMADVAGLVRSARETSSH
jgi:CheY-like chemotaxis protein